MAERSPIPLPPSRPPGTWQTSSPRDTCSWKQERVEPSHQQAASMTSAHPHLTSQPLRDRDVHSRSLPTRIMDTPSTRLQIPLPTRMHLMLLVVFRHSSLALLNSPPQWSQ